jgi:hypothetical protein
MTTEPLTPYRPPSPDPGHDRAGPQPVVLVDRIAWQWYLVAAAVPVVGALIGAIAGIVFMARSKIGPALALWATCWLALGLWSGIGTAIAIGVGADGDTDAAQVVQLTTDAEQAVTEQPEAAPSPSVDGSDGATQPERSAAADETEGRASTAMASCGNLQVRAATTSCAFAQNVFWEYWNASQHGDAASITAYSPAGSGRVLRLSCDSDSTVICTTTSGAEVRIPSAALAAYTQEMADHYAATHDVGT